MKNFILQLALGFILLNSCSANVDAPIILVASTPINKELQTTFGIISTDEYDFMKWSLTLAKQKFTLNLNYGESQPNTTGFINGGKKAQLIGTYSVTKAQIGNLNGNLYELKDSKTGRTFSFLQINEHIFQLLSANQKLMVGNAGYSYTLNSILPVPIAKSSSMITNAEITKSNTALKLAFAGRTPCQEIARDNKLRVSDGCFKIKWSMVLNRDPKTLAPTNFSMRRINKSADTVIGQWQVLKGIGAQPQALIYQLKSTQLIETINLLVGDDNVLFVLDKDFKLYPGNELHSYTLNVGKPIAN